MTPLRSGWQIDWEKIGAVTVVLGFFATVARFVFMPLIGASLRKILKEDLDVIAAAAQSAQKCLEANTRSAEAMLEFRDDLEYLQQIAKDNREFMQEMSHMMDILITLIDRRQGERRLKVPEIPPLPEKRRRLRNPDQ